MTDETDWTTASEDDFRLLLFFKSRRLLFDGIQIHLQRVRYHNIPFANHLFCSNYCLWHSNWVFHLQNGNENVRKGRKILNCPYSNIYGLLIFFLFSILFIRNEMAFSFIHIHSFNVSLMALRSGDVSDIFHNSTYIWNEWKWKGTQFCDLFQNWKKIYVLFVLFRKLTFSPRQLQYWIVMSVIGCARCKYMSLCSVLSCDKL